MENHQPKSQPKSPTQKHPRHIAWNALEFQYVQKTKDWYWILWLLALSVAVAAFLLHNWSFSAVVILSAFTLSLLASKQPQVVSVHLDEKHIQINKKTYSLKKFEAFYINTHRNRLLLRYENKLLPLLIIPTDSQTPIGNIRFLLEEGVHLEEDEELMEPVIELLMERLGF